MKRPRPVEACERPAGRSSRPQASARQDRAERFRTVANSAGGADVYLYDEIGPWGVTAADFVATLRDLGAQPINLHLNSPGGDVWDGMAMYNAVQAHPGQVTVHVDGMAASAASFLACAGDRLVMAKNSQMMIHNAWSMTIGDEDDHAHTAKQLAKASGQIAGIYADRAGGDESFWRAAMRTETWYTGPEAVAAGLADEVSTPPGKTPLALNTWDLSLFNFAGRDKAPDPVPIPPVAVPEPTPVPVLAWDAATIRNSLKEAFQS